MRFIYRSKEMVLSIVLFIGAAACSKNNVGAQTGSSAEVAIWTTRADQNIVLAKQIVNRSTGKISNTFPVVVIDSSVSFQSIDGFGFTLTGGSAYLINKMGYAEKAALLNELFGSGENSIGISYLRISMGASDLNANVYSYDDLPAGQTDPDLFKFSLSQDTLDLIPVLKQILAINPSIKIMGTPWSPPVWMKDNANSMGGNLLSKYYRSYANYFVKYINAMKERGIRIDAITLQNEPQHGGNNPSMKMDPYEQATFVKDHLGPVFMSNAIQTNIIVWDHNCDNPNYPITVLGDPGAYPFIDGSAFHLYNGDISALSTVHKAFPQKNLYFTEQWTGMNGTFAGDLQWHMKNVIIGSMNNWSRVALEWNLASDPNYAIHTPGGCTECKGGLTISGSNVTRNVSYYIVAHASKFVPAGSVRIGSSVVNNLFNVAFRTPAGNIVLIIMNDSSSEQFFNISFSGKWIKSTLAAGSVSSIVF